MVLLNFMAISPTPLLTVSNLAHRFDGRPLISFGSFNLSAGTILLVRGVSGSGKSTLLHLLGGVLSMTTSHGSAVLDGVNIGALSSATRDRLRPSVVGWMPQRHCVVNSLSVLDNVLLPVALAGRVDREVRRRAASLLHSLAILELAKQRPATLSVGQTARACLARALLAKPKLLLADEPTAALDEASTRLVAEQMLAFAATGGAVIAASHDREFRAMLEADTVSRIETLELPR
jgi:putative ABC transport system ATP-binding protein